MEDLGKPSDQLGLATRNEMPIHFTPEHKHPIPERTLLGYDIFGEFWDFGVEELLPLFEHRYVGFETIELQARVQPF